MLAGMILATFIAAGTFLVLLVYGWRERQQLLRRVTELSERVQQLQHPEDSFASMFSANPLPMWVQDSKTLRFLAVNDAAIHTYGYSRDEFLAMTVLDIRSPEEAPALIKKVQGYRDGFNTAGIWKHRRKNGDPLFAEIHIFRLEKDGGPQDLVVAHDVTEGIRTDEALRESRSSLQALIDNAPFGISQTDLATDRVVSLNPAMRNILGGYNLDEALQLKISKQVYADPKERGRFVEMLRSNRKVHGYETDFVRRDGKTVRVRLTGSLGPRDSANCDIFSAYVEDLTQQSVLEQQVRQVQKLEAVGRLAGGVAHDFNNILVVIKLSTELMLRQVTLDNPLTKPLLQVSKAADRAAALTKQMLAFGRQQILQVRIIDINTVITEVSHMLRRIIGEDIQLVTHMADTLDRCKLDPDQLSQVILNLAVNARDAMPKGGVLHIETANVYLDEAYTKERPPVEPGRYVMVAVSDTGVGIDKAILPRIFDPFFTTKDLGKGTGLGLSIVYGIVKQSGGYIWVYSEPGQGTSFKIYFPATSAAPQQPVQNAERSSRTCGQTVLVVEDEAIIRSNLRECLEQLGYQVLEALDGNAALEIFDSHARTISLVLTDLVMPGISGHELAQELARRHADVSVLFMSGYTEDSAARREILSQGSPFLQKPFSVADLSNSVQHALALKLVREGAVPAASGSDAVPLVSRTSDSATSI